MKINHNNLDNDLQFLNTIKSLDLLQKQFQSQNNFSHFHSMNDNLFVLLEDSLKML